AAWGTDQLEPLFQSHVVAAELATSLGMGVNAGHDLNLDNLAKFASIPSLLEVSIGHAFTVDSLAMGMSNALNAYQERLR
ncbi:MAG: pyridoxine 5'-phosphate synthase, partial [Porticoccaceae bacterium]